MTETSETTPARRPRALLSVYDKTGVIELARGLVELGWDLVSSGGTARHLAEADIPVTDVADITGFPAIMGHRVVTLHPKVHGGLLADRSDPDHLADMLAYGIEEIDLMVGNLYPFANNPSIELIDIGGPAMVRAAAKNFAYVGVVVDPGDYDMVLSELREHGELRADFRKKLALAAFRHTAAYDADIVQWLSEESGDTDEDDEQLLSKRVTLTLERSDPNEQFRYGENPHQGGARYRVVGTHPWHDQVVQLGGLPMSLLNWFDVDAAWLMVHRPEWDDRLASAVIKHANACGFAVSQDLLDPNPVAVYQNAYDCDPRSAFGGIVAVNYPVGNAVAEAMVAAAQADVIIAPSFSEQAIEMLKAKRKNTRLLTAPVPELSDQVHIRQLSGGTFLVQEAYRFDSLPESWQVVTERQPTPEELADGLVAWVICGLTKSNAIVHAQGGVAWGIGAGQQNRVESGEIATKKANGRAAGGACASDAFYPFPDGIEAAADAGVALIVQPGGAQRDDENIAKANELGIGMVFTGERQFRH